MSGERAGKLRLRRKGSGASADAVFRLENSGTNGLMRVTCVGVEDEITYLVFTEPLAIPGSVRTS